VGIVDMAHCVGAWLIMQWVLVVRMRCSSLLVALLACHGRVQRLVNIPQDVVNVL